MKTTSFSPQSPLSDYVLSFVHVHAQFEHAGMRMLPLLPDNAYFLHIRSFKDGRFEAWINPPGKPQVLYLMDRSLDLFTIQFQTGGFLPFAQSICSKSHRGTLCSACLKRIASKIHKYLQKDVDFEGIQELLLSWMPKKPGNGFLTEAMQQFPFHQPFADHKEWAQNLELPDFYFKKRFQQKTNLCPDTFLSLLRIHKLIRFKQQNPLLNLDQLCRLCHFSSKQQLIREFQIFVGQGPESYFKEAQPWQEVFVRLRMQQMG